MFGAVLFFVNLIFFGLAGVFVYESYREQESRALKFGLLGVMAHLILAFLIVLLPSIQLYVTAYFGLLIIFGLVLLIPGQPNAQVLQGSKGFIVDEVVKYDERDIVFARNNSLEPGTDRYDLYYKTHPEHEERDTRRRAKGGNLGRPGSIDSKLPPNVSMLKSAFQTVNNLALFSVPELSHDSRPVELDPVRATEIVKGWTRHLGADLVGACRVDQRWIYSHRGAIHHLGNVEDWGKEIHQDLPFAVVIATEMAAETVAGAPHTPLVIESAKNYADGAFITTTLAKWFTEMGYRATAQHGSHYEALMVPLAVDAGLGQLGRQGYLIADKYGARCRVDAVLTDMPLDPDQPVDLGAEEFCQACLKCAESCPSNSIPLDEKTVDNGLLRWKLDDETCHDYWGKVGTDCGICMAICPFSRPNRSVHNLVKWILKRSRLARKILPHLDNIVYGRRWRPRQVPTWINYRP